MTFGRDGQVTFTGHAGGDDGGSLWVGSDSTVVFASATQGVAFDDNAVDGSGAAIHVAPGGTVDFDSRRRPRLLDEHVVGRGGAISLQQGTLDVGNDGDTTFTANHADLDGGASTRPTAR